MGMSMFQVRKGLSLDGLVQVMAGSGAPGAAGDASLAPIGSFYLDYTNGQIYIKRTAGTGTDKWLRTQNSDDMTAALNGLTWRVPASIYSTALYANLTAAQVAANTGTIDGVTVTTGARILFDNITGSNKNVYIVTGTVGAGATLVEDAAAVKGEALFVQNGSGGGKQYAYNGTAWVQQGAASATEIGYIQNFVGKSSDGNSTPTYTSQTNVSNGQSLDTAIGTLDATIGALQTGTYLSTTNVATALTTLNTGLKTERMVAAGTAAASTPSVIDTVPAATGSAACHSWDVLVQNTAVKTDATLLRVSVLDNGTSVDYNVVSVLAVGNAIANVAISCNISAGNLLLSVSADIDVSVSIVRKNIGVGS